MVVWHAQARLVTSVEAK